MTLVSLSCDCNSVRSTCQNWTEVVESIHWNSRKKTALYSDFEKLNGTNIGAYKKLFP